MTFEACAKRVCTKVDINRDCFMEDLETFKIKVEKYPGVGNELVIEPSERQITIEDRDSMSFNITTDNQTSSGVYICVYV